MNRSISGLVALVLLVLIIGASIDVKADTITSTEGFVGTQVSHDFGTNFNVGGPDFSLTCVDHAFSGRCGTWAVFPHPKNNPVFHAQLGSQMSLGMIADIGASQPSNGARVTWQGITYAAVGAFDFDTPVTTVAIHTTVPFTMTGKLDLFDFADQSRCGGLTRQRSWYDKRVLL